MQVARGQANSNCDTPPTRAQRRTQPRSTHSDRNPPTQSRCRGTSRGSATARDRYADLLDSAVHRPQVSVFGDDAYPGIDDKAAALLESLVRNHALVDGNNRIGWLATAVFYGLNAGISRERTTMPCADMDFIAHARQDILARRVVDLPWVVGRVSGETKRSGLCGTAPRPGAVPHRIGQQYLQIFVFRDPSDPCDAAEAGAAAAATPRRQRTSAMVLRI